MKVVAVIMVVTAVAIGSGGAQEFRYFGPETRQFWAGVLAVPASIFFALAGVLLWRQGRVVRQMVLMAALCMVSATVEAYRRRLRALSPEDFGKCYESVRDACRLSNPPALPRWVQMFVQAWKEARRRQKEARTRHH